MPYMSIKTYLVGKVEEHLIPSVSSGVTSIPLGTGTVDPTSTWATELPRDFVIQDGTNSERVTVTDITGSSGSYAATISTASTHAYSAPRASILTPGYADDFVSADFNCRLRGVKATPKITPDGESEKYATGDHRRDQSIMGAMLGDMEFTEKFAINLSQGTGAECDITAGSGAITAVASTPTSGHAGTGYRVGDWLIPYGGTLGIVEVASVTTNGAIATFNTTPIAGGSGYTTGTGATLTATYGIPKNDKFLRAMGHKTVVYPGKGIGYQPLAEADDVTLQLGLIFVGSGAKPKARMLKFSGCSGDGSIGADGVGKPYVLTGKFQGKFVSDADVTYANTLVLTAPESRLPEKYLSNTVQATDMLSDTSIQFHSSKWNLAFGNKIGSVENQADPTGYDYFYITERDPKLTIDPLLKQVANEDVTSIVKSETLREILVASALFSPHVTVEAVNCQLMYPSFDDRGGSVATGRTYRLLGNNIDGVAVQPLIPDEAAYEILLGARS